MCVFFYSGAPEGSTDSGYGEAWDRTCYPWFTRHSTYTLHNGSFLLYCYDYLHHTCDCPCYI